MSDGTTEQHEDSALAIVRGGSTFHVVALYGRSSGSVHEASARGLSIGRATDPVQADLTFDDARMSRLHVRIADDGSGWQLEDLGSRNGGFVDGVPFAANAKVALGDGSVVRLGNTLLVFRACAPDRSVDSEREVFPGGSPAAAAVRQRVTLLAGGTGHVLILGETGTGKERVARRIGRVAPPRAFVPQNCAEVSTELARSELFGHVRGAFSGAVTAKEGLVDAARDGALFLDEVGELPLDVQGDLLRFLEDGSYRPVGSTELRTSSCRIIAATNVDLDAAVRMGGFRRDLVARLRASNAPLVLPPLRERREDILGWARLFLDEAYTKELPTEIWTAGAAECIALYTWPENLRELRGVMRALVETEPTWPIEASALPARLQADRRKLREQANLAGNDGLGGGGGEGAGNGGVEPTREAIEQALAACAGRMLTASALLGVDRRKLYRLCEKLGINIGAYRAGG